MIDERQLHHGAEPAKPVGQAEIVRGGGDIARGMIVGNDKLHRAEEQGIPEDNLRIHHHLVPYTGRRYFSGDHWIEDDNQCGRKLTSAAGSAQLLNQ